jgi:hypothetical protein
VVGGTIPRAVSKHGFDPEFGDGRDTADTDLGQVFNLAAFIHAPVPDHAHLLAAE